jgi:tRNA (guanine-N(7)-)-methyltransferase subunit TRM82
MSTSESTKQERSDEKGPPPILGHVSMLTGLALGYTINEETGKRKRFLVSTDRDEHVRITEWPKGVNIRGWCLGHTKLVFSPIFERSA